MPTSRYERTLRQAGYVAVAGVDEAGRGALFGPVFAAAVILDPDRPIRGLDDSKQLSPERRTILAARIHERARAWAVAGADAFEIDHYNILEASRRAMLRAIAKLSPACDSLLIDAVKLPIDLPQRNLIHGDSLSFSIAAASILAKTARDAAVIEWDRVFPDYRLASNKGYSAPDHLAALRRFGPTSMHRFSFEPVRIAAGPEVLAGLSDRMGQPSNGTRGFILSAPETFSPPHQRPLRSRILHYCFALFTLEVGLFLLIFPWTDHWMFNYFQDSAPWLRDVWADDYFRGAISGLGIVNIYLSIADFFRTLRSA